ncbi:hypothetical protein PI124_g23181, partial [Phytophthora idaei]
MQARSVSDFLRPQRSTHIHAMLSSGPTSFPAQYRSEKSVEETMGMWSHALRRLGVAWRLRDYETDQPQPKQKRIRRKTQRRAEQCRVNQARYRQKQLDHAKWVERTVQKLRANIPVLELQRTTLRHGRQQDVWNVVVEYFRIFRFGVLVALPR